MRAGAWSTVPVPVPSLCRAGPCRRKASVSNGCVKLAYLPSWHGKRVYQTGVSVVRRVQVQAGCVRGEVFGRAVFGRVGGRGSRARGDGYSYWINHPPEKWLTANVDTHLLFRYFSRMSSPVSYDLQGQGGGVVLSTGTQTSSTGSFRWIQVVNDAVLSTVVSDNITNAGDDLISITLPAGLGIGGRFHEITVTSGVVIAYYA